MSNTLRCTLTIHMYIYIYILSKVLYVNMPLMLSGKALPKGISAAGRKFWVSRHFES